jgi:hypothetical protein
VKGDSSRRNGGEEDKEEEGDEEEDGIAAAAADAALAIDFGSKDPLVERLRASAGAPRAEPMSALDNALDARLVLVRQASLRSGSRRRARSMKGFVLSLSPLSLKARKKEKEKVRREEKKNDSLAIVFFIFFQHFSSPARAPESHRFPPIHSIPVGYKSVLLGAPRSARDRSGHGFEVQWLLLSKKKAKGRRRDELRAATTQKKSYTFPSV